MISSLPYAGIDNAATVTRYCGCGNTRTYGTPKVTTLFGSPAMSIEGIPAVVCDPIMQLSPRGGGSFDGTFSVDIGHEVRVIAAHVGDKMITVIADAPAAQ